MVGIQRDHVSPSAFARPAVCRALARHAGPAACGRSLHDSGALGIAWRLGEDGCLTGPRGRRHHAYADRPERASALAVLFELARGVGQRRSDAVSARACRALADPGPTDTPLIIP